METIDDNTNEDAAEYVGSVEQSHGCGNSCVLNSDRTRIGREIDCWDEKPEALDDIAKLEDNKGTVLHKSQADMRNSMGLAVRNPRLHEI